MRTTITQRVVDRLKPVPGKDVWIFDDAIRGFHVRIDGAGWAAYGIAYTSPTSAKRRRMAIGTTAELTAAQARERAKALAAQIALGTDPLEAKQQHRRDAVAAETVTAFAERYMRQHCLPKKKPQSIANDRALLTNYILPAIGSLAMRDVGRADIITLHQSMADTPIYANRCLALLSKMFNLSELWGVRPDGTNPCRHVARNKERRRQTFLSSAQLARLGDVLAQVEREGIEPPSAVPALRLLLATGARRSEILTLKWDYVRLEERRIDLPDSKTGPKSIPLNSVAIGVLTDLQRARDPEDASPWVLPGRLPGKPLVGLPHSWERIRTRAGLAGVRLHDLRHTNASLAAASGQSLVMIGKLLGHTQPATTARYAHLHDDPVLEAAEAVGRKLEQAMQSTPTTAAPAAVVPLRAKRRRCG